MGWAFQLKTEILASFIGGFVVGFEIIWDAKLISLFLGIAEVNIFLDGIPEDLKEMLEDE